MITGLPTMFKDCFIANVPQKGSSRRTRPYLVVSATDAKLMREALSIACDSNNTLLDEVLIIDDDVLFRIGGITARDVLADDVRSILTGDCGLIEEYYGREETDPYSADGFTVGDLLSTARKLVSIRDDLRGRDNDDRKRVIDGIEVHAVASGVIRKLTREEIETLLSEEPWNDYYVGEPLESTNDGLMSDPERGILRGEQMLAHREKRAQKMLDAIRSFS